MKLVIADDHPLMRAGLRTVLASQKDITILAEASDGRAALEAIRQHKPDVAVLDIQMPLLSGLEVARQLVAEKSRTALVMLTLHREQLDLQEALEAGVTGYVLKDDASTDLVDALRSAARGEMFVSPKLTGLLVRSLRRGEEGPAAALTQREREVLRHLAEGMRSKEIAAALGLSTKTVESYRAALMDKLNIRSIAGLVKYALKHRLTDLGQ